MMLLCQDYMLFKHYYAEFQDVLAEYADQFELYYTDDQSRIDRYVDPNLRKSHMLPVVVLADPLQRVKYERAQRDGCPIDQETTFRNVQVPYKVDKILPKMLEAYFDAKLIHDFQTQVRPAVQLVKEVNADQFRKMFMNDAESSQCLL